MTGCPSCQRDNDILCVTIRGTRVLALDANAHVRVFVTDPGLLAEAGATVQEALDRLQAVVNEAYKKASVYAHVRDTLALAGRKGASA